MNTDGRYKVDKSTKQSMLWILILALTIIGVVFWLIYKIIEAIYHAIVNRDKKRQNRPVTI